MNLTSATEDDISIGFAAIEIRQPIGPFYIASISSKDLFKICYMDIRQIRSEGGIDEYLGIQRVLNEKRVAEIKRYVRTVDATFPTAVILGVDERCTTIESVQCAGLPEGSPIYKLTLRNVPDPDEGQNPLLFRQIARVLDGQHRIQGLESYDGPDFDINVAIFVGLDIASQASVFSVVNLAQTKVNNSLVYDLFAYDQARTPEKTCHELAVALDAAPSSPFFQRIKRLGTATEGRFGETLSQATFVRALLPYLTNDVILDRDIGRRGGHFPTPTLEQARAMIFRLPFVKNKDGDIGAVLWAYFGAVADRWPDAWNAGGSGLILNKTTGFNALMIFLRSAYLDCASPGEVPDRSQFRGLMDRVQLNSSDFNSDRFKPGSSGVAALRQKFFSDTEITRE